MCRRIGEDAPQVAIVNVRKYIGVLRLSLRVVLRESLGESADRLHSLSGFDQRWLVGDLAHQLVDVLELSKCWPASIAFLPFAARPKPDSECLREIFIGMTLRIPETQVLHVALARRVGTIVLGIALGRFAEKTLPFATPLQLVAVLNRVSRLVPHDARELVARAAFDVEHLAPLQPDKAWMRQVEGNRKARHTLWGEP